MPKATSSRDGASRRSGARKSASVERKAAKVVDSARDAGSRARAEAEADAARIRREAEADAAQIRAEAEEHARRLILDARATADGVRAEGMEVVSNLRLIGDGLRDRSEQLLRDIQTIHARMVGELEGAGPESDSSPPAGAGHPQTDEELEVPDFMQPR